MLTNKLIDSLSSQGWYVWDGFLALSDIQMIKQCLPKTLQDARIGHRGSLQGNKAIRGDQTVWLEPEMREPVVHYLDKMEQIRQELNCQLYLDLRDFETHFCPPNDLSEGNFLYDVKSGLFYPVDIGKKESDYIDQGGLQYLLDFIDSKTE